MKWFALPFVLVLSGCAKPVPVKMTWPAAPEVLQKQCEELKQVESKPGGVPITDILKVVVENYSLYYECSNKVDGWNDWYKSMKRIYDEVGK